MFEPVARTKGIDQMSELLQVAEALREYIDAIPDGICFNKTMPGVDRDWVDRVIASAKRNPTGGGGSAFPSEANSSHEKWHGMNLRDWFAGKALEGMLAKFGGSGNADERFDESVRSYDYADSMLKARQ